MELNKCNRLWFRWCLQSVLLGVLASNQVIAETVSSSPEHGGFVVATPTPTPIPPTPTPRATATPSPTPAPRHACPYVLGQINWMGWRPTAYFWGAFKYGNLVHSVPCVRDMIRHAWLSCDWVNNQYEDDCYSIVMGQMVYPDGYWRTGYHSNGAYCQAVRRGHNHAGSCAQGWFYLDRQCKVVPRSQVGDLPPGCSFSVNYYESSPISLILQPDKWSDTTSTLTRFPLNPAEKNKWYSWKASPAAPLLVHDPEHSGKITSATQLFGEWTFGGQRIASLSGSSHEIGVARPWKDGFEALATLDKDGNKRIEGEELKDLALWFDEGSDGIAAEGEVRRINTAGITALFYESDSQDSNTRSVVASRGFERLVDSKLTVGKAVDWYGAAVDSPFQLIDKLPSQNVSTGGKVSPLFEGSTISQEVFDSVAKQSGDGSPLSSKFTAGVSGLWEWSFTYPSVADGAGPGGFILLRQYSDTGKITGISLTERAIAENEKRLSSNVLASITTIEGYSIPTKTGKPGATFSTQQIEDAKSTSVVTLEGKDRLNGTTTIEREGRVFSYQWTANRVSPGSDDEIKDTLERAKSSFEELKK